MRAESESVNASLFVIVIEAGAGMTLGIIELADCVVGGAATGPDGVHAAKNPPQMMSMAKRGTTRVERLTGDLWVNGKEMV